MNRYIILRDLKSIQGAKFFKNEVVIGKANNNGVHIDVIRENGYKNNVNNLVKNKDIKKVSDTTPLTDELLVRNYVRKSNQIDISLTILGLIGGGSIAYFKKQGILEYGTFMILGAVAGFGIASFINSNRTLVIPIVDDKKEEEIKSSETDNKANTNN
jgi:hypothetical protein